MKANEIKKGLVIEQDNKNILIKKVVVQSPSSRSGSTLYKITGSDISSGQKFERRYKGDEVITAVDISRRTVQLLFHDADSYTFMDSENYDQFMLSAESLKDEALFLYDGLEGLSALISDGELLGVELPNTMSLEITECAPGMKSRIIFCPNQTGNADNRAGGAGTRISHTGRNHKNQHRDTRIYLTRLIPQR